MDANRRSVLRAIGAAGGIGIAGCTTGNPPPVCGEIATPASVSLPVASGGPTSGELPVEVLHARLTESLVVDQGVLTSIQTSDAISETEGQPLQFLEVAVRITPGDGTPTRTRTDEGTPPVRQSPDDETRVDDLSVSLGLDDETYRPPFSSTVSLRHTPFSEGHPIGVAVPVGDVAQASVRFETRDRVATWEIPDGLVASFDAVPSFAVLEATITGEECTGTSHGFDHGILDLTIENTGDRDGRFQAVTISYDGPSDVYHYLSVPVPGQESVRVKRPLRKYESGELELRGSVDDRILGYERSG